MQIAFLAPSPSVTEDRPKSIGTNLKSSPAFLIRGILWGGGPSKCSDTQINPRSWDGSFEPVGFKLIRSKFMTPLPVGYPWILRRGRGRLRAREVEKERNKCWEERSEGMKSGFGGA